MCEEFENEKKKEQNFLTYRSGDLNPRFSVIFPLMIWIFMEIEEPEIKSGQGSKEIGLYLGMHIFSLETEIG